MSNFNPKRKMKSCKIYLFGNNDNLVVFKNGSSFFFSTNSEIGYYTNDIRNFININNIDTEIYSLYKRLKDSFGTLYQYRKIIDPELLKKVLHGKEKPITLIL